MSEGNRQNRQQVLGARGIWLLVIEFGARAWYFGSEPVAVESTDLGQTVQFKGGLTGIDFVIDSDRAAVQVRGPQPTTWGTARRRYGPLQGRGFRLYRWHSGNLEDSWLALQGVVVEASYGGPETPEVLSLELERDLYQLSEVAPFPNAKISTQTHSTSNLFTNAPSSNGKYYPIVIGYPGRLWNDTTPAAGSPAIPYLATSTEEVSSWGYIIAGHRVQASNVRVWDMSAGIPTPFTAAVAHDRDDLGRSFSYFLATGSQIPHEDNREVYAGWAPELPSAATGGAALTDQEGNPVLGLGDVLYWGAQEWMSPVRIDWAEVEANRTALNRYKIDTVITEPVNWLEWLQGAVYELFSIEEVNGPRGLYWREVPYVADPRNVRAKLTTTVGGAGVAVSRESGVADSEEEVVNQITLDYAPAAMNTSNYRARVTFGPDPNQVIGGGAILGGAQDDRLIQDIRCQTSVGWFGLRSFTFESPLICQRPTADLVGAKLVQKHAIPAQVAQYRGGVSLADLRRYDTVEIQDTGGGADFPAGTLALVWDIQLEDAGSYLVTLRVPFDPIRDPGTQA